MPKTVKRRPAISLNGFLVGLGLVPADMDGHPIAESHRSLSTIALNDQKVVQGWFFFKRTTRTVLCYVDAIEGSYRLTACGFHNLPAVREIASLIQEQFGVQVEVTYQGNPKVEMFLADGE